MLRILFVCLFVGLSVCSLFVCLFVFCLFACISFVCLFVVHRGRFVDLKA